MVDADSDDAKELSLGASLWSKLDSNMNASNAEFMAQALARLLADPTVNVAGKYSSCSSQIGDAISTEVNLIVTKKNDDAVTFNDLAT